MADRRKLLGIKDIHIRLLLFKERSEQEIEQTNIVRDLLALILMFLSGVSAASANKYASVKAARDFGKSATDNSGLKPAANSSRFAVCSFNQAIRGSSESSLPQWISKKFCYTWTIATSPVPMTSFSKDGSNIATDHDIRNTAPIDLARYHIIANPSTALLLWG